jgi:hypothetical protein
LSLSFRTAPRHPGALLVKVLGAAAVIASVVISVILTSPHHSPGAASRPGVSPSGKPGRTPPVNVRLSTTPGSYLGVYEKGVPASYGQVDRFARATGRQPNIVLYYSQWHDPFQPRFAMQARSHGAIPFIQMEPWQISMAAIASGRSDAYLTAYARAVARYRYPVLLGFGHEMNGTWYPWGWTRASPVTWIAAWRHIVTLFRREGAKNVTWIWTVNEEGPGEAPLRDYWPGARYVGWVGITGYLFLPQETFHSAYAPTITALRTFIHRPILISETAVGQIAGQARNIPGLFSVIRAYHLLGFVWFDRNQNSGPYHQLWRLEGHRAAMQAFRLALRHYG